MQNKAEVMQINENIRHYPSEIGDLTDKIFALGDLHGNAMKLFYVLLRYGVLSLPNKADFDKAWSIYDKPVDQLSLDDLTQFEEIVSSSVVKLPGLLDFIGDEFADRGQNDLFTAFLFKKLHDNNVPYRIQLSNHASYLLSYLEKGQRVLQPLRPGQTNSLDNYIYLKNKFPSLEQKMSELLAHAYKDHLCLMGYAQSDAEHPFLISHAPLDGLTISGLSRKFGVMIDEPLTPEKIVQFVDQVNAILSELIIEGRFTDTILSMPCYARWDKMTPTPYQYSTQQTDPMYDLIWNRHPARAPLPCGFLNIHGHVGEHNIDPAHYINLDSDWGKPSEVVYDPNSHRQVTIPPDDIRPTPVFIATISLCDRLLPFFQGASAHFDLLTDERYSTTSSGMTSRDETGTELSDDSSATAITGITVAYKRKIDDMQEKAMPDETGKDIKGPS